jgi:hypothetical protein
MGNLVSEKSCTSASAVMARLAAHDAANHAALSAQLTRLLTFSAKHVRTAFSAEHLPSE